MASSCGTNRPRSTKARMCSAGPWVLQRHREMAQPLRGPAAKSTAYRTSRYWDWSELTPPPTIPAGTVNLVKEQYSHVNQPATPNIPALHLPTTSAEPTSR